MCKDEDALHSKPLMVFNSVPAVNDSYTKIQMSGNRIWCENQLDGIFKQTDETGAFIDKRCAKSFNIACTEITSGCTLPQDIGSIATSMMSAPFSQTPIGKDCI